MVMEVLLYDLIQYVQLSKEMERCEEDLQPFFFFWTERERERERELCGEVKGYKMCFSTPSFVYDTVPLAAAPVLLIVVR